MYINLSTEASVAEWLGCRTRNQKLRVRILAPPGRRCVLGKGTLLDFSSLHPGAKWVPVVICWGSEPARLASCQGDDFIICSA